MPVRAPGTRPRARAGRVLPRLGAPRGRAARASPAGRGTAPTGRSRRCSRATPDAVERRSVDFVPRPGRGMPRSSGSRRPTRSPRGCAGFEVRCNGFRAFRQVAPRTVRPHRHGSRARPLRPPRVTVLLGDVVVADAPRRARPLRGRARARARRRRGRSRRRCSPMRSRSARACSSREQAEVERRLRADGVREGLARGRGRVLRQGAAVVAELLGKRRRRGVRARERPPRARSSSACSAPSRHVAVQHQLRAVDGRAARRDAREPAQAVLLRRRAQPAGRLPGGHGRRDPRSRPSSSTRTCAAMNEQLGALQLELQKLQAERDKTLEVAAEHDRSTAKGRPYEEAVFEAVDAIARAQGDDCDAVGDLPRRRRAQGRRARRPRRLRRPAARRGSCSRPRTRTSAQEGARRARRGDGPARRRLRRLGRPRPRTSCPAARSAAARGQRRQAVRRLRPRGRLAAGARGRVLARPRPRPDGQGRRRGARRAARCAPRSSGRWRAMDDVRRIKSQLTGAAARSRTRARSSTGWPSASAATSCRSTRWSPPRPATTRTSPRA